MNESQTVSAATEEQLSSIENLSKYAVSLSQMAEKLQGLLSKFRV
ncbi:hypothetical protein ACFQ88_31570 [Paenibacillus sp. NPDC056579]